jgi:DNA modification methylase
MMPPQDLTETHPLQTAIDRIIRANCMDVLPSWPNASVDLVLTDIPYNLASHQRWKDGGIMKFRRGCRADIVTFDISEFVTQCVRLAKGSVYIFCGDTQISAIVETMSALKLSTRVCVWFKTNFYPLNGDDQWCMATEFCVYGRKKNGVFNERFKSNEWRFPKENGTLHPTQKPVKLFKYLIEASSDAGGLVLDPCIGSGTTAIATIAAERHFIGIEADADYHRVAQRRVMDEIRGDMFCLQSDPEHPLNVAARVPH